MNKEVIYCEVSDNLTKLKHDNESVDANILQNDRWVTEIESTDGHLGTTLR